MKALWILVLLTTKLAWALPEVATKPSPVSKKISTFSKSTKTTKPSTLSSATSSIKEESPVHAQAILVPRNTSYEFLLQICFIGLICIYLMECLKTAGIPHISTVFALLYQDEASKMPLRFPTALELTTARIIARNTKELIPPIALPSSGALMGVVASMLGYLATLLLPKWFVRVKLALNYRHVHQTSAILDDTRQRPSVLVRNDSNEQGNQATVICKLQRSPPPQKSIKSSKKQKDTTLAVGCDHPHPYFFEFNQCRFYLNVKSMECSDGGPVLHKSSIQNLKTLVTQNGLTKAQRSVAKERYRPYNEPKLASPTVSEVFSERISSPLVVVQLLGQAFALLENGVSALLETCFTLFRHYESAFNSIKSAKEMAKEVQTSVKDTSSLDVMLLKKNGSKREWIKTTASELLPGDVFMIPQLKNREEFVIPVDALLLGGQCLTNEAVLTGESVPQSKRPLDFEEEEKEDALLDMHHHRNSILFSGTTLLHSSKATMQTTTFPNQKESGLICLALRTGMYSSKGQLLQALKTGSHVGSISNPESEKDSIRLIASLSIFALASCISMFIPRPGEKRMPVPAYRRVIQCTRIACASIPSYLPLSLSTIVKSCSRTLRDQADVVCSEPGSLLTAATIDTVVFDKTGTLTADTQALSKLIRKIPGFESKGNQRFQRFILAGCHSLVNLDGGGSNSTLIGDPLENASLRFSGWKYNSDDDSYSLSDTETNQESGPIRLWQIKSFPFDPSKRLSTTLVIAKYADNSCKVWSLTKGSSDSMIHLYNMQSESAFKGSYKKKIQNLDAQGYRSIALGSKDLSNSSLVMERLFPEGLACDSDAIMYARSEGASLHRRDIESLGGNSTLSAGLDFSGFACFDASLRPSSSRVLNELFYGGINSIMLTGDSIDAALSVGRMVGLVKQLKVAILETSENNGSIDLTWRIISPKSGKQEKSAKLIQFKSQKKAVTPSSLKKILNEQRKGLCAIATTGQALEKVLNESSGKTFQLLLDNLSSVSIIARATPSLKESVITCLRQRCGKKVMMCGDGVNDVAAMKAADVSVALLNGFGAEDTGGAQEDTDNKRRIEKLQSEPLGRNRKKKRVSVEREASISRMKSQLESARKEIDMRASTREGSMDESGTPQYSVEDVKDILSATLEAVRTERRRKQRLRVGGGDAARILADERKAQNSDDGETGTDSSTIKPGEASLVAAFSCLNPSIDGVEAILRAGVATAASAVSSKKIITLNSLMSAYHLAGLYRDGVRYGKFMHPVELYLWMFLDGARYAASCSPRPHLPSSYLTRPPTSMFHPSCILSTVAQAFIHIVSMAVGTNHARKIQAHESERIRPLVQLSSFSHPDKSGRLLSALAARDWGETSHEDENEPRTLFRRPPFTPNYETNLIFILSIFTGAVTSFVNHGGKPFYRGILESQSFCTLTIINILFCTALIMESFPILNRILELRPLPSIGSKLMFLFIAFVDVGASMLCQNISDIWFLEKRSDQSIRKRHASGESAADMEADLLKEEAGMNSKSVLWALAFVVYLILDGTFKK